jgi:hypothetical protein
MDALLVLLVFVGWLAFIGVAIGLVIQLLRNRNFFPEDRGRRIGVTGLLAVLAVFAPLLGMPVLLVVWFVTRSREPAPSTDESEFAG